jgi:hypothetical protein
VGKPGRGEKPTQTGFPARAPALVSYVADSVAQTGITYFVCDFAFGSLPYAAAARSVELFANEVMPAFR